MNKTQRKKAILEKLKQADAPLSATTLASLLGVSRQIIVGDIALLRAENNAIAATPRGYMLERDVGTHYTIACRHQDEELQEELYAIVDNGGGILDVIVEHPVYGQLSGKLEIFSRYDVDDFTRRLRQADAPPLSLLTGGIHLHTLSCPSPEVFERIVKLLREKKFLFE